MLSALRPVVTWIALCVAVAFSSEAVAQSAAEIARRSRERGSLNLVDLEARLKLLTVQGDKTREQQVETSARRIDGRLHTVTRFTAPASSAGVSVLAIEETQGREAAISIYLPKLRRVRKVAPSQRGEAFMQTDLTYADLAGADAVRDEELTREADTEVEGRKAWVLRATPGPHSPYGEVRIFVDQQTAVPLRLEYKDKSGRPTRRYVALKLGTFEGRTYAERAVMENLATGSRTEVQVLSLQRSTRGDDAFTERALERG